MLSVEAMTGRAERFFHGKTELPKECYPIVTVRNGEAIGGIMYYRDPRTGVMGGYMLCTKRPWMDAKNLAKIIEFPFVSLGVNAVVTYYDGSEELASLYKKMGGIFATDDSQKIIFTRANVLKAAAVLRGEA